MRNKNLTKNSGHKFKSYSHIRNIQPSVLLEVFLDVFYISTSQKLIKTPFLQRSSPARHRYSFKENVDYFAEHICLQFNDVMFITMIVYK